MNHKEALDVMRNGGKVRQGKYIYFLGKLELNKSYTLEMRRGKTPLVTSGFKRIKKDGLFTNA